MTSYHPTTSTDSKPNPRVPVKHQLHSNFAIGTLAITISVRHSDFIPLEQFIGEAEFTEITGAVHLRARMAMSKADEAGQKQCDAAD
jgi:hypothetical protein